MPMCNISCQWTVRVSLALDCTGSDRVGACVAIALFEFFTSADGFDIGDAVDGQDAIEVVDLVLQEFGKIALISGFDFERFALQTLIPDGDPAVSLDLH